MSNHTSVSDILLKVINNEFHKKKKKKLRWSLEVDASVSIVICDYLQYVCFFQLFSMVIFKFRDFLWYLCLIKLYERFSNYLVLKF